MSYICRFGEALYYGFQTMILYIHLGSKILEVVKQVYSCFSEDDSEMHEFQLLASAIGMNLTPLLSYWEQAQLLQFHCSASQQLLKCSA